MNIPNKITILRVLMIPLCMWLLLAGFNYLCAAVFLLAAATDWLDGFLARKKHLISNFGKFADPLADKLLVLGLMLCLVETAVVPAWVVMVIITRELVVTGFRLIAASAGHVIAAGFWGKIKTVVQMAAVVIAVLLGKSAATSAAMYAAAFLTAASGIWYIVKNRAVLFEKNMLT